MKKEFIPYEQAEALEKLGFDEPCMAYYDWEQTFKFPCATMVNRNFRQLTTVMIPLYQQAFRWFREKHGLGHMINGIGFETFIMNIGGIIEVFPMFKTYEEAELTCLNKLIEIVKTKL